MCAAAVFAACATSAPSARPAESAPKVAPQSGATLAPELLLNRVQVALGALDRIEREWPSYRSEAACVLVFDETTEWLLHCPAAPTDDFTPTGQTFLGLPVFSAPSLTLGGPATPYEKAKMLVGTVRPLKLVDAKHEYFHGYQLFHPTIQAELPTWTPSMSRDNLAPFYKRDAAYQEAVKKEFAGLQAAIAAKPDQLAARAALKAWRELYAVRLERFGPVLQTDKPGSALAKVDGFVTFLEGVARYVETRFLVEETLHSSVDLKGDSRFRGFADFTGHPLTAVEGRSALGSEYFYGIGMYVCFLLDAARPEWKRTVMASPRLLVGEVDDAIAAP